MFGPKGNPRADNLFQIIKHLKAREGIPFRNGLLLNQTIRIDFS
jgi:hypothetical protein